MEYVGFSAAFEEIKDLNLDVVEIATECQSQITSKLSKLLALYLYYRILVHTQEGLERGPIKSHLKNFHHDKCVSMCRIHCTIASITGDHPGMIHSHDIWHAAKN